jgi:hypothetical protein
MEPKGSIIYKGLIMSNKSIISSIWNAPTADEVQSVVSYLGGINAVCRIAKKHRNTVSKWCKGEINIDFANWKLIKECSIETHDKMVVAEYVAEMKLLDKTFK